MEVEHSAHLTQKSCNVECYVFSTVEAEIVIWKKPSNKNRELQKFFHSVRMGDEYTLHA